MRLESDRSKGSVVAHSNDRVFYCPVIRLSPSERTTIIQATYRAVALAYYVKKSLPYNILDFLGMLEFSQILDVFEMPHVGSYKEFEHHSRRCKL